MPLNISLMGKTIVLKDGAVSYQLVGEVMAYQGDDA